MSKFRYMGRVKLHPTVWAAIVLIITVLTVRLMTLSFPGKIGQAKNKLTSVLMTRLCINSMESGSSLISYSMRDKEKDTFAVNMLSGLFAVNNFTKNGETALTVSANTGTSVISEEIEEKAGGRSGIGFHAITNSILTRDYILTNGAGFHQDNSSQSTAVENSAQAGNDGQLQVDTIDGNLYFENKDTGTSSDGAAVETMKSYDGTPFTREQLKNVNFLVNNFYIVDAGTRAADSLFDSEVLLNKDMKIKQKNDSPQILIYHTHSHENYVGSRDGVEADTVVGIGTYLENILEKDYGYNVLHDKTHYDYDNNDLAYNHAREGLTKILEANPTIEVMIDIHRDGLGKRSINLNGKDTSQIMLYNGLCRDQNGPLTKLSNPYLTDNLAFGLQLQMKALELYPGFFYKNYLNAYRYNLDLRPKSILIELGTYLNTLESAQNAIKPFAQVLDAVLQGK